MILSSETPLNASVILRNIQQDYHLGRYPGDYRGLLKWTRPPRA